MSWGLYPLGTFPWGTDPGVRYALCTDLTWNSLTQLQRDRYSAEFDSVGTVNLWLANTTLTKNIIISVLDEGYNLQDIPWTKDGYLISLDTWAIDVDNSWILQLPNASDVPTRAYTDGGPPSMGLRRFAIGSADAWCGLSPDQQAKFNAGFVDSFSPIDAMFHAEVHMISDLDLGCYEHPPKGAIYDIVFDGHGRSIKNGTMLHGIIDQVFGEVVFRNIVFDNVVARKHYIASVFGSDGTSRPGVVISQYYSTQRFAAADNIKILGSCTTESLETGVADPNNAVSSTVFRYVYGHTSIVNVHNNAPTIVKAINTHVSGIIDTINTSEDVSISNSSSIVEVDYDSISYIGGLISKVEGVGALSISDCYSHVRADVGVVSGRVGGLIAEVISPSGTISISDSYVRNTISAPTISINGLYSTTGITPTVSTSYWYGDGQGVGYGDVYDQALTGAWDTSYWDHFPDRVPELKSHDVVLCAYRSYAPEYYDFTLTIGVVGFGSVSKFPDKDTYGMGESVAIVASPGDDYMFTGWSGDISSPSLTAVIVMSSDKEVFATFEAIPITNIVINSQLIPGIFGGAYNKEKYRYLDFPEVIKQPLDPGNFTIDSLDRLSIGTLWFIVDSRVFHVSLGAITPGAGSEDSPLNKSQFLGHLDGSDSVIGTPLDDDTFMIKGLADLSGREFTKINRAGSRKVVLSPWNLSKFGMWGFNIDRDQEI